MQKDIAVVTGASKGIGFEIARKLSAKFTVCTLSRTRANYWYKYCDITDSMQVEEAFEAIKKTLGIPKILINCAGYVEPKSILETSSEDWIKTIDTNLTGVFYCVKEFIKYNKTGGRIVNIASTSGQRPSPGWAAYGAAKAGVINFSQSLSEELKPYGIRVYCVCPGRCATELRRKLAPDEDQSRIMQPGEVADFVYYLVSEDKILDSQTLIVKKNIGG